MNLADYLSELLGQHDEVSVPGLGCFARERINGYYNENEARFYPPYHQVKFVPKPKEDDDTFTQYVADKKNISLASSKYFAEKFISKLREDAAKGKYLFADLGSFQTEQEQLVFKPNEKIAGDPSFYGYPPVNVYKINQPVSRVSTNPVFAEPVSSPVAKQTVAVQREVPTITQPQYFEDEPEPKRSISIWLILFIIFIVIALALFGIYKFYPGASDKFNETYHKITHTEVVASPVIRREVKPDTVKKAVIVPDTTAKIAVAADTTKQSRFEVIADHFRQLARVNAEVKRLKSLGLDAKIVLDAPGPFIRISVGTYKTANEAESVLHELIASGKIGKKQKSETLEIKPPK